MQRKTITPDAVSVTSVSSLAAAAAAMETDRYHLAVVTAVDKTRPSGNTPPLPGAPRPSIPTVPGQSETTARARGSPAVPRGVMNGSGCRRAVAGEVAAETRGAVPLRDTSASVVTSRCATTAEADWRSDRGSHASDLSRDPSVHPRRDVMFHRRDNGGSQQHRSLVDQPQTKHEHNHSPRACHSCRSSSGVDVAAVGDRKSSDPHRKHLADTDDDRHCRPTATSTTSLPRLPER